MHPATSHVASGRIGFGGMHSTWGHYGAADPPDFVDVTDGTWQFRVRSNGRIEIIGGPSGIGTIYTPGVGNYNTVLANLKAYNFEQSQAISQVLGGGAVSVSEPNQGVTNVMSWLAHQIGAAGTPEERAEAQQRTAEAAAVYGPGFIDGVRQLLSSNGKSLAALQRELARKQAKYYSTTSTTKKLKLKFEIAALEQQIAAYQATVGAASGQLSTTPASGASGFPWWLVAVAVGGVLLLGSVGFLARRKR